MSFRVVIPARIGSTRLPDKPLVDLGGAPMVVRVLEQARASGARQVIVATDDERVRDAVAGAGGTVRLTREDHPTGTDRLAEVARVEGWAPHDVVVNVQGDEPLIPPPLIARLARALEENPDTGMTTFATPIASVDELFAPQVVKVVVDETDHALYFSRAPIPWSRDFFRYGELPAELPSGVDYLRHLGLYAYRVDTLEMLASAPSAACERAESLEQLRALHAGIRIHVTVLENAPPGGVDTPDDLMRVRAIFEEG